MPRTDDPPLPRARVGGDFVLCMDSVPYWPYLSVLLLCSVLLTLDGTTALHSTNMIQWPLCISVAFVCARPSGPAKGLHKQKRHYLWACTHEHESCHVSYGSGCYATVRMCQNITCRSRFCGRYYSMTVQGIRSMIRIELVWPTQCKSSIVNARTKGQGSLHSAAVKRPTVVDTD